MKKSIFKKALLGLAAIVGFAFAVQPTVVVTPSEAFVDPGARFMLVVTYTNTDIMCLKVIQSSEYADIDVPIPDETKNLPTESIWYVSDIIPDPNTTRIYQFKVQGSVDSNGNRLTEYYTSVITTNNVQP